MHKQIPASPDARAAEAAQMAAAPIMDDMAEIMTLAASIPQPRRAAETAEMRTLRQVRDALREFCNVVAQIQGVRGYVLDDLHTLDTDWMNRYWDMSIAANRRVP